MSDYPQRSYFICTTPRCGSNLLCEILTNTGVVGRPHEYFNENFMSYWFETFNASTYDEYLPKVLEATATNGVFGVKLMGGEHFNDLINRLKQLPDHQNQDIPPSEMIANVFPNLKYIWLSRRNKVRQSVSFMKAEKTGIWRSDHPEPDVKTEPIFSQEAINHYLQAIIWQNIAWQEYFSKANIIPLTLVYEDFTQSLEETVRTVLDYLEISRPPDLALDPIQQEKLSGSRSEMWVQRYYDYMQTDLRDQSLQETLNRLSSEEISRRIPIRKLIKAFFFKFVTKSGLNYLHHL